METKILPSNETGSFRIIFAISDFTHEISHHSSNLKITIADTTKSVSLPCKEAVPLDFIDVPRNSAIEFAIEDPHGSMVAFSEFALPNAVFENPETEV